MIIACYDAGIPFNCLAYSIGDENNLFVYSNNNIVLEHSTNEKSNIDYKELESKAKLMKETILFELKDMFDFE